MDLARAAEAKDIVTRAIGGHATETMQHHDSTVAADEKPAVIAKVIAPSGMPATPATPAAQGGARGGVHRAGNRKAARH